MDNKMYVYSKYLLKMSTQDVYTRCLLKIQNAYVVQQQQSKNTTPKPPIVSTFCHLSGPQQALCQCELLMLLMNVITDGTILCKL